MKRIVLLASAFFCGAAVAMSQIAARIAVQTEEDVIALHQLGLRIDDVKIRERVSSEGTRRFQVSYNPENRFVTIIGSEREIEAAKGRGFNILSLQYLSDEPLPMLHNANMDTIAFQFGWPRSIFNGLSLYENSPTIADINRDGQLNISVTNAWGSYQPTNPPYVITWRRNGAYLPGFPTALQPGFLQSSADAGISAAGDIFGDDKLEIVCGDENGYLYAFNADGTSLTGFPVNFGTFVGVFTPALADFDGDGKCEIAVISHNWDSPYGNAFLHLFKVTATGPVEMPGFPVDLQRGAQNSPAIGDLDGDGELEIVVGTGGIVATPIARIIAFRSTGQVMNGFPFLVGASSVGNSPTLYDVTNDGKLEILIRMKPDNDINGIYAIDYQGQIVPGYPFPITYGNPGSCVAVGDINGDGIPELAYGGVEAVDSGKVWAYDLSGNLLTGYPARVFRTWVDGSVAIADVDGDGKGDVVCGTNGVSNKPGVICGFNYLGQVVQGFPLMPGNPLLNSFETHPTLVDIDGDGDTEIFAGRLDKYVYGWDTPGMFDSTNVWRTFKGNAARTGGQLRSPSAVSVRDREYRPADFRLAQNYPNPFNPTTTIRVSIPVRTDFSLTIHDVLGRQIKSYLFDHGAAGVYGIIWDGTNDNGQAAASGVYFYHLRAGSIVQSRRMVLVR
ncbi:MAG: T9SS type A sorting domain-containing protein [Bacteroidetes bacterium]|nr:T9SS type A sorting domain-containing protein [Bacteroidota bacterium]MCW5896143.1 T9SS type A sorting domain-containing protein [Bacteroidota bacterium]